MPEEAKSRMISMIPARRIGTPEDIGNVVSFLLSGASSYINGEIINVGGGFSL
jgi:NAD(P)-dependent dehydrogenase (short-subunit alcohol dehydrogenase family)